MHLPLYKYISVPRPSWCSKCKMLKIAQLWQIDAKVIPATNRRQQTEYRPEATAGMKKICRKTNRCAGSINYGKCKRCQASDNYAKCVSVLWKGRNCVNEHAAANINTSSQRNKHGGTCVIGRLACQQNMPFMRSN